MRSAACATASGGTSANRREAAMTATTLRRLIVLGLIVLWEFLPRSGLIPELFLPALSSTLIAGWNEAGGYRHAPAGTRRGNKAPHRRYGFPGSPSAGGWLAAAEFCLAPSPAACRGRACWSCR